jgi:hypothetical protein
VVGERLHTFAALAVYRLDQDLERITNLFGVGELFGARLKILKRP